MTPRELYKYAEEHNALDYNIKGTSISCGPHFDRLRVNNEYKDISIEDGSFYTEEYWENSDFDFIPYRTKEYKKKK